MLALLLLTGPLAVAALLFAVRRRDPAARAPRADRWAAIACALVTVMVLAAWPSATFRAWLGYVDPVQCLGKAKPVPPAATGPVDVERLKTEVRQQRQDVGPANPIVARDTHQLDRVTGAGSSGRTVARWDVAGTDLGHPFVLDGRLGLVFGDTFSVEAPHGPGWRSNVLGWVDEPAADRLEITAMKEFPSGRAGELIGSLKINGWEQTVIPTDAVAVDGRIVVHYMSIACWGAHGRWAVRQAGLAVSDDGGQSFHRAGRALPAGSGFAQVAFVPTDDHVYVFGIPEGRDGAAHLARVDRGQVADVRAWRYWDGEQWQQDRDAAVQVVAPPVGELSVAWSREHQRWLMVYLDELRGGLVLRTAQSLTGPWSRARLMVSSVEYPSLYAPYLLPEFDRGPEREPGTIRYTMSRFNIYNVVLMESRLVDTSQQDADRPAR